MIVKRGLHRPIVSWWLTRILRKLIRISKCLWKRWASVRLRCCWGIIIGHWLLISSIRWSIHWILRVVCLLLCKIIIGASWHPVRFRHIRGTHIRLTIWLIIGILLALLSTKAWVILWIILMVPSLRLIILNTPSALIALLRAIVQSIVHILCD